MSPTSRINAAIGARAATQLGNITRQQLLELGLSRRQIAYRIKTGSLHVLFRGVYAVGHPPTSPLQWAAAAVLACGDRAMLSHGSAMTLYGLWKRWDRPFDVTVAGDRRVQGIRIHTATNLRKRDVRTHNGIPVTSAARTLLTMAPKLPQKSLARAVNTARHERILALDEVADIVKRCPTHAGAPLLKPFIGAKGGPTRSGWEDGFPEFCKRYGLPEPIMNARVGGYEVDALFPDEKLIVELDSWEFHSSKQSFEDDRDKDADTAVDDHQTIRATWDRMHRRPEYEAARLQRILSGRRRLF